MGKLSAIVMDHFRNPRNNGRLERPGGEGWAGSLPAGRFMRIQVRLENGRIDEAAFGTSGCAPAIAAGSFLTEWIRGRSPQEARALTSDQLTEYLGGLPPARLYCAALAVEALHRALDDALNADPGRLTA